MDRFLQPRRFVRTVGRAILAIVIVVAAASFLIWLLPPSSATAPQEPQPIGPTSSGKARVVTKQERDEALARARIWRAPAVPIAEAFLGNDADAPQELECTFKLDKPSGTTPKFNCTDRSGRELKIKYGVGGELPSEAAATRLLSALGFLADHVTIVERLKCYGCPKEPFTVMKLVEGTHTTELFDHVIDEQSHEIFPWVAVEERFPATAIEADDGTEGWAFFELKDVKPEKGSAPQAQIDALRLLAVFLAHWDNKSPNQRLVCLSTRWPESAPCPAPFLMLQDVGSTFGPRKVDLEDWEGAVIWEDRPTCTITMKDLPVKGATFETVRISNEGRLFLSRLLEQLSDAQLDQLFAGARFDERRGPLDPKTPIAEWVRVFKARRSAITDGPPCPAA